MLVHILLIGLAGLAVPLDANEDKTDLKKLEGNWVVVAGEERGKPAPEEKIKKLVMRFAFTGNKVKVNLGKDEKSQEGTFTIDATKKPKHIDMKAGDLEIRGIYAIDGDTLKLCLVKEKKYERPGDFTTKVGDGHGLFVLKREKK